MSGKSMDSDKIRMPLNSVDPYYGRHFRTMDFHFFLVIIPRQD